MSQSGLLCRLAAAKPICIRFGRPSRDAKPKMIPKLLKGKLGRVHTITPNSHGLENSSGMHHLQGACQPQVQETLFPVCPWWREPSGTRAPSQPLARRDPAPFDPSPSGSGELTPRRLPLSQDGLRAIHLRREGPLCLSVCDTNVVVSHPYGYLSCSGGLHMGNTDHFPPKRGSMPLCPSLLALGGRASCFGSCSGALSSWKKKLRKTSSKQGSPHALLPN